MEHFIQEINYKENPDFQDAIPSQPLFSLVDDIRIKEIIKFFDAQIEYLTNNNVQEAPQKFLAVTKEYVQELRNMFSSRAANDKELLEVLTIILDNALGHVKTYLLHTIDNPNTPSVTNSSDQLAKLKNDGFLELQIPHTPEFLGICKNLMERYKKMYEGQDDWRGANSLDKDSAEFKLLYKFIEDNHIVELISAYKKMQMEVYYIAADYSHNRQKWFRNNHTFDKLVPTNYYHYDADANVAKMLVYLSDVNTEDGPFKFVKSSNNLSRSIFLSYVHYSIDSKVSPLFFNKENLYGRGLFLYRKDLLMKLPQAFMGSTHFGDDLLETSLLSKYMVDKTVTFTRNKGAVVLFDGFRGIHAGGNADKGERLAVQIAFKKVEVDTHKTSALSSIKGFAKKLLGK